jgi:diguanylate cyclase (GGDEF)-like protein
MKILLVEDDESLADLVKITLNEQQHCVVDFAKTGYEGLELADSFEYDLILLDLILPQLDGIQVCQKLRSQGDSTPILLLTAQDTVTKKVKGLDAGADDYLVKPFDLQELLARIRALSRRSKNSLLPVKQWGGLHLDLNNCQVTYQGNPLKLTAKEYRLLELFLRYPQRIFSQNALLDHLWSWEEFPSENAVRTHIKGLRQKLKQAGIAPNPIETIYGLGYRLKSISESSHNDDRVNKQNQIFIAKSEGEKSLVNKLKNCGYQERRKRENTSTNQQQTTVVNIQKVWQQHQAKYLDRVQILEQVVQACKTGNLEANLRNKALEITHTLAGSLGSFGLTEASAKSRQLEQLLNDLTPEDSEQVKYLSQLVEELSLALTKQPNIISSLPLIKPKPLSISEPKRLLIVDDDIGLTQALVSEATTWGLQTTVAHDITQAKEAIATITPDVILLDLSFPKANQGGFELMGELAAMPSPIPTIVFTAKESFAARVQVARLGGKGFLQKPVSTIQVMEAISQVLQQSSPPLAKILVVDEETQTLDFMRTLLEPWGFKVILVEDVRQFWDVLEESNPDLLMLNLEMSHLSGIELCQVVRNDPRWYQLPILLTSNRRETQTIQQVFAIGADDYLCKPIVPEELLARILNRLDKERYRRQLIETDALTGVTNRRTSIQQLNRFLSLAKRQKKPWCFIILDLDNFKQINDNYGHDAGDQVLRVLGKLLKQEFRAEDVIARWGGEEFVLGLYDMRKTASINRLTEFLTLFHQQQFSDAQQQIFQVTFSAGVAEYPLEGNDLETLYQTADAALYQAKATGKNRIL